jgi:hypothetical protein
VTADHFTIDLAVTRARAFGVGRGRACGRALVKAAEATITTAGVAVATSVERSIT